MAPYLAFSLVNLSKPENKNQFKLLWDRNSNRMNDFLINTSIPVTLSSNVSSFRHTIKSSKLDADLLKTMTNYNFNVDHSNLQDQKIIYEIGKKK